jgi:selenocysteine-specific elongation factor
LSHPAALVRGDRFILRWLSPSITVGGGIVVDPGPRRRHRRFRPEVIERLQMLTRGTPEEITIQALERGQPCEARELVKRLSLPVESVTKALDAMLADGRIMLVEDADKAAGSLVRPQSSARVLVSALGWRMIGDRIEDVLQIYHERFPLRQGMPREELRSRLQERFPAMTGRVFNQVMARAANEGTIVQSETSVWLVAHQVKFTEEQQKRADSLLSVFRDAPYTTPSVSDCVSQLQEDLFAALLEDGTLVKVSADVVYLGETLDEIRSRVIEHIRQEGSIDVAQVRDMLQASRKYAVSLLEYFDQQRVTKRVGDARVLR